MNISGFENIISIEKFEYLGCIDKHEICSFSACIKEEEIENAINRIDNDICFENDDFKFAGHIMDVAVSKDISGVYIDVKSIGTSYLYDTDKHSRIFQQEDKTISDILSCMKSMSDVEFQGDEDYEIKSIIFQDNETEWEFVIRLINRFGYHIFTSDKVFIGKYGKNQIEIKEEDIIDYKCNISAVSSYMKCRIDQPFNIGDQIKFQNRSYFVETKKYVLDNEKYYYEYFLTEKKDVDEIKDDACNVILYGKVINNDDPDKKGRLQIDFENENIEDCMKDSPIWIDRIDIYASKGMGIAYIPQIDDIVRIHLFKDDCKIIGCVRTDAYGSPYENCEHRYLMLEDEAYLKYGDGKFVLHNKDCQVEVSEEDALIVVGDKISVSLSKDKVIISKEKTAIEISSDINIAGGKFIVEAKSDASVSGSKVNIKGKSGVSIN